MADRSWWHRLVGGGPGRRRSEGRVSGIPPSSNGASSFHLGWDLPGTATQISAVLEVLAAPTAQHLYFWALQADVAGPRGSTGGAHLGLQWHDGHPGSTAVNWGGYHHAGPELAGSDSALPSSTGNPNTRDYSWSPGHRYRLTIERARFEDGGSGESRYVWRGSVEETSTGETTVVRDLFLPGDRIVGATMWSEVFARCDDSSVTVRWSAPTARVGDVDVPISRVRVNYQTHRDGGCANTSSSVDGLGFVQRTNVDREASQGTWLEVL